MLTFTTREDVDVDETAVRGTFRSAFEADSGVRVRGR
jgi:hypothetical protein